MTKNFSLRLISGLFLGLLLAGWMFKGCSANPNDPTAGPFPTLPGYHFEGEVVGTGLTLTVSDLVQMVSLPPQASIFCILAAEEQLVNITLEFATVIIFPSTFDPLETPLLCGGVNITPNLDPGVFNTGVETLNLTLSLETLTIGDVVVVTLPEPIKSQVTLAESLGYVLLATNNSIPEGPTSTRASTANSGYAFFFDLFGSFIFTNGLYEEILNGDEVEFRLLQFNDISEVTSIPITIDQGT